MNNQHKSSILVIVEKKKGKHGGKRVGAGRKSKSDEEKLAERLMTMEDSAFKALEDGLKNTQSWAVKIYFDRRYGLPKQQVDLTSKGQQITSLSPIHWVDNDDSED